MKDTLKVAGRIGAELGAAKAELEKLRGLLQKACELIEEQNLHIDAEMLPAGRSLVEGITAALSQQADHVRDAAQMMVPSEILKAIAWGDRDDAAEAIGSLRCLLADPEGEDEIAFPDSPEPTDTYTAVDMATAAAQGFRDGQAAVEQAPAQDERKTFEAWAKTQGDKWLIVGGLQWSAGTDDYASARTNAAWAAWQERAARAARPAQTEQQPIGYACQADLEWEDEPIRICRERFRDWQLPVYAAPIAQTAPQPEQSGLVEAALREAVAYLDENPLNEIASGSMLHRVMGAALAAQGGE